MESQCGARDLNIIAGSHETSTATAQASTNDSALTTTATSKPTNTSSASQPSTTTSSAPRPSVQAQLEAALARNIAMQSQKSNAVRPQLTQLPKVIDSLF